MTAMPEATGTRFARVRAVFGGRVQGVGFRPFVYRLARRMGLGGCAYNAASGAVVEAEGPAELVEAFLAEVERAAPAPCRLVTREPAALLESAAFDIRSSAEAGARPALAMPDLAPCSRCLDELHDPADPRYRYPFIACTDCGPRYSVLESLPFDRGRTTMRDFPLAGLCRREYDDPDDRRFHAEMIAAPDCGPRLALWDEQGMPRASAEAALSGACELIRRGGILALKGVGGFQLLCDARDEQAVAALRARKAREAKPFAVMVADPDAARMLCEMDEVESAVLSGPEAPIVLLARRAAPGLAPSVAPGLGTLGLMLPASPLHYLLARELDCPVVATSGNLAGEPLCTDNDEALDRLGGIADGFLVHDRRIARPLDDSVVRVLGGRAVTLRLGRGLAPLPVALAEGRDDHPAGTLAVGAHVKAAPALLTGGHLVLGQHVGDLDSEASRRALARAGKDLSALFGEGQATVACDAHPDYASTRLAERLSDSPRRVWHHHAHVLACQLDNGDEGEILGVCWDGTGLGPDGTLWGGEFLRVEGARFERSAHLRAFKLPGGAAAIREPLRAAAALLHEIHGGVLPRVGPFQDTALHDKARVWARLPGPVTSSAGRLFDAAAVLLGLCTDSRFEGEPAMRLESHAAVDEEGAYEIGYREENGRLVVSWEPLLAGLIADMECGVATPLITARFHNTLAGAVAEVAVRLGARRVALTGGCFQNRILCNAAIHRLRARGIEPLWHRRIPPNDGGIAAGQALAAWYAKESSHVSGSTR